MLTKLSKKICIQLVNNNKITDDEKELYVYGVFLLLSGILSTLIIILFGFIFGCLLETIVFYISFRGIRDYAGGYHANTEIRCQLLTTLTFLSSTYIISISDRLIFQKIIIVLSIIAIPIIIIFSPLDTPSKPLDTDEKKKYRKISLIILSAITFIIIISIIFGIKLLIVPCCMSLILESILLVAGVIKGRLVNGN